MDPRQALSHLPIGAADRRIANQVYRRAIASGGSRRVTGRVGAARMRLDLSQWPEAQAFMLARYDPSTVSYVRSRMPPDGVMIDGGAHVGLITFQVAAEYPRARIHAFEPHPEVARRFRENLAGTGAAVVLNEVGLSNQVGRIPFSFDTHSSHHGAASASVPVTTLDEYLSATGIEQVDVLKLDLEGHELQALEGSWRALSAHRVRAIVLETMDENGAAAQASDLLAETGYTAVSMPDCRPSLIRRLRPFVRTENTAFEPVRG